MKIIDGKKIADEIGIDLTKRGAPERFLAAVIAGDDPASLKFVERKKKFADAIGAEFKVFRVDVSVSSEDLLTTMKYLADDPECGGLMVQLPLPYGIDKGSVIKLIPKDKDADVMGDGADVSSPAVLTVFEVLKREVGDISDMTAAVVGMGSLVGKPVSDQLKTKCKKLITVDKGDDIRVIKEADIVVLGTGERGLIAVDMLKDDAVVIDFGCSFDEEGKICGDLDIVGIEKTNISYTPTPGGTGPILIAKLFENFYKLNGK
jgi:methylenetetrahydrofolate dehydrogenase (NADP+)/methenyltetrahydrofolate cyclohydrolase